MSKSLAFSEFDQAIDQSERLLNLLIKFRELGAAAASMNAEGGAFLSEKLPEIDGLVQLSKSVRSDLPSMSGALALFIAGRFEHYVKARVEERIDAYLGSASTHEELPEKIRTTWRRNALNIVQSPEKYGRDHADSEIILSTLVSNGNSGASPNLLPDVVTITERNMRPDLLHELLKIVQISDFWGIVGHQLDFQQLFGEDNPGKCTDKSRRKLNQIMELRNSIAHPSSSTLLPSPEDVLSDLQYIRMLGRVIDLACSRAIA